MFKPAADAWAIEVLRHIQQREPFETSHIELKAEMVEPKKFAPQLAGLANAARWHPVLVIFGVERKKGLIGIMPFESGEWYEGMRACFEFGEAPVLAYQNFALFSEKTFGVFVFETSNPPYVVGNTKRGGPREVPWRYGSNTNPAGRQELLTMLLPRLADPESEVLTGEFRVNFEGHAQLRLELFMYPAGANGDSLVIPFHRVTVRARDEFGNVQELPKSVSLVPPRQHSSLAKLLDAAVALPGPSKLELVAQAEGVRALRTDSKRLEIICSFRPAHFSHDVAFSTVLSARQHPDHQMYWEREEQHSVPLHTNADVIDDLKQQLARFAPKTKLPTLL